jgi:hypothetical protein
LRRHTTTLRIAVSAINLVAKTIFAVRLPLLDDDSLHLRPVIAIPSLSPDAVSNQKHCNGPGSLCLVKPTPSWVAPLKSSLCGTPTAMPDATNTLLNGPEPEVFH